MRNAENLLGRLNYTIYVNEKFIAEITSNLTEVLSRNKEVLKKSGIPDEEVGRIMLNMAAVDHTLRLCSALRLRVRRAFAQVYAALPPTLQ